MGSTCGSAGKETPCNGRRPRFHPWVGKIPWRTERLPTPVFRPGEFHELCSPWGCKESDTTVTFTFTLNCVFYAFPIINFSQKIPRNIIDGVFLPPQPTFPSLLEICQIPERHCSSKTLGEVNDSPPTDSWPAGLFTAPTGSPQPTGGLSESHPTTSSGSPTLKAESCQELLPPCRACLSFLDVWVTIG